MDAISDSAADEAVAAAVELLASARRGTEILCAAPPEGFRARAFTERDWDVLIGLADDDVRRAFSADAWDTRAKADTWTAELLDGYRCQPCADGAD